jgi:uncharacterized protein YgiM (DUF1202 family)
MENMSREFTHKCKCAITCALFAISSACADQAEPEQELSPITLVPDITIPDVSAPVAAEPVIAPPMEAPVIAPIAAPAPVVKKEIPFTAFTGKVKGRNVRVRLKADLDSYIVKELNKNDLLSVVGEKDNFWVIEPPSGFKAYVFRSFVLENVVEGNHVNIRLQPSLEAPVIGQLNAGDKLQHSTISARNNKWLEIAAPSHIRFYVSKDFVEFAGGPELKTKMDSRRLAAEQLLDSSSLLSKTEMRKSFEEIDIDRLVQSYNAIINEYSDFPEYVEQAKESLATLQENYAQKRLAFQETQPVLTEEKVVVATPKQNTVELISTQIAKEATDRMKLWEPVEESLYLTWSFQNNDKNMEEFYAEQKISSVVITGILEAYSAPVKNKPGDFIIRDKDLPVAYVYSTQVDLSHLVGKNVTLRGSQRPNNNFAFPAYFVLAVD